MRLHRDPRRLPALALLALLVWLTALVLAPATLPPGTVAGLDGHENRMDHMALWVDLPPLHATTYAVGDLLCHQKSWRTLSIGGNQLPVDERMTAIFVAAAPALALSLRLPTGPYVSASLDHVLPARWRSASVARAARTWTLLVVLALLPAAIDVLWENAWHRESTMTLRLVTGSIAGLAGGLVLGAFLASADHVFGRRLVAHA